MNHTCAAGEGDSETMDFKSKTCPAANTGGARVHPRTHPRQSTLTRTHMDTSTCARNCPHENVHCVCTSAGFPASSSSRKDGILAVACTNFETVPVKCKLGEFFKSTCLHTRSIHSYPQAHTRVDARTLERRTTLVGDGRRPALSTSRRHMRSQKSVTKLPGLPRSRCSLRNGMCIRSGHAPAKSAQGSTHLVKSM